MKFFPAMALRAADASEVRYLRRAMRWIGAESAAVAFLALFMLVCGVLMVGSAFVGSSNMLGMIVMGVICIMIGGPWTYSYAAKWWKARGSGPRLVYRVEGRLSKVPWRDAEGNLHQHWELANQRLVVPNHWDQILDNENPYGVVAAEVVPGPGDELVPLKLGDRLSIANDIQHGLLSLPSKARMFIWGLVTISFLGLLLVIQTEEFRDNQSFRTATIVLGLLAALTGPWAIIDMIRIRRGNRRMIRHVPRDLQSEKTPLPGPRS